MQGGVWKSALGKTLRAERGDITRVACDAIVNAANSMLAGGGGVDGAIHDAAGPSVMADLNVIRSREGRCPPGSAVVTGAGNLRARYIIHAVGPVYRGGAEGEPELLASCYRIAFRLAQERDLRSLAFPAISTGIYGYPAEAAAEIAVRELKNSLASPASVEDVLVVLFDDRALQAYLRFL